MTGKVVVFNGETYVRNPNSKYYFKHTTINEDRRHAVQLHRAVWEFYNGPIPDGCHIHHIDHDIDNNDISNLECISASEHLSRHGKENFRNAEYREKNRLQLLEAQEKAKEWHASDEGREWHRKHVEESIAKSWVKEERTCEECGKTFIGTKRARFCSPLCGQHSRMKRAGETIRDKNRVCEFCGKPFVANKGIQKYCSAECRIAAQKERRNNQQSLKSKTIQTKGVYCFETDTVYESIKDAGIILGVNSGTICSVCRGKGKSAGGYHFCYADNMKQHV